MSYDASGTITTGGTAQNLFVRPDNPAKAQGPVNGFAVYNPDSTNDLWIGINGNTAVANGVGCIRVAANGGGYETPAHKAFNPAGAVSILGANTGQKFTAMWW